MEFGISISISISIVAAGTAGLQWAAETEIYKRIAAETEREIEEKKGNRDGSAVSINRFANVFETKTKYY